MAAIEIVLSPILWMMQSMLGVYNFYIESMGLSILLLSFSLFILILPFQRMGSRLEARVATKMKVVNAEVRALKGSLKGEKLLLATEKIYLKHGYHPIHSVALGASLLASLPVLISAILLFTDEGLLTGHSFLAISDLSEPDALLGPVNLLPLLMFTITLVDALLRFRDNRQSQGRFLVISVVLLFLVYNLPAGLVLYWIGNNLMSFILSLIRGKP